MGTSSITRVIIDGEVKVNQYCQFDGDPTSRGIDVLGFVRSLLLEDRLEQMKDVLRKITLLNRSESDPDLRESTYTGAPLTEEGQSVLLKVDFFMDQPVRRSYMECVEFLLDREKLTLKEASYAMAAERRVGNDILPFLLKHSLERMQLSILTTISTPSRMNWSRESNLSSPLTWTRRLSRCGGKARQISSPLESLHQARRMKSIPVWMTWR